MSVVAVVPTLGRSPYLERCLQALGGPRAGVVRVVVAQRVANDLVRRGLAEHELHTEDRLGFSAATNLGIDAAESEYVATVNDDAIVDPRWLAILRAALERKPRAAGAQGVNLQMTAPLLVDGCGLAWNYRWEAVQIGHGEAAPPESAPEREIYGVSATAALYRRSALDAVRGAHGIFDERLDSFYEDVDLAGRLRAAGFTALLAPGARAAHAGSTTASRTAARHVAWIYGNRHLVLAALLGAESSPARSLAWRTDLRDAIKSWRSPRRLAGILGGAQRAWRYLPEWRRDGPPLVTLAELERLRDG
ncbi:MAG: glycosyltransferase family 2 protein [Acidobacteriota bacterium]